MIEWLAACPMCRVNLAQAENASTIDLAVLVLLAPTLAIIAGLAGLIYRAHRSEAGEVQKDLSDSINSYVDLRSSDTQRNLE